MGVFRTSHFLEAWARVSGSDLRSVQVINFEHLTATVEDVYGYRYVVPTHQGQAAKHIMSQLLVKSGDLVPGNMYFITTKMHQKNAGGRFRDVIMDEAYDPQSSNEFKGLQMVYEPRHYRFFQARFKPLG